MCFLKGVVLPFFWPQRQQVWFLIWPRMNLFGLLSLSRALLLCPPQPAGRAQARKAHRKLEGARRGPNAFGSYMGCISLGWVRLSPLGCAHVPTWAKSVLLRELLVSRWDPVAVCGGCKAIAKEVIEAELIILRFTKALQLPWSLTEHSLSCMNNSSFWRHWQRYQHLPMQHLGTHGLTVTVWWFWMHDPGLWRYTGTTKGALERFFNISLYKMAHAVLYVLGVPMCLSLNLFDGILHGVYG